ncbi:MAG: exodeoxyribonuclease VII small subunit [Candidatus Competibacteraceae bacterium]|jgi:exodeoxyribonuclease VII small subunit|nr:exodeoxyribonuclease VII small subunit [Candidatus Competibacteraceae bacterium]
MAAKKSTSLDFEKSLAELEKLVEQMEHGELSLEASLQHFERGIALSRACQTALQSAEQKVERLLEKDGQVETVPFESPGRES